MRNTVYLVLGLMIGFLFAEMLRRQKMERLQVLEMREAHRTKMNAEYEREWQQELANMPFDERMEYELWEASMRLDNWMPPPEEDDDAET
jgi:hypothetical protein